MEIIMKINIIGDIAGRYDELMLLLDKMPEADLVLSVGDLVDRGMQSKQVIQWFMDNPKAEAVYGNHEDLMINGIVHKDMWLWVRNGGGSTLRSYLKEGEEDLNNVDVPAEHINWLQQRPQWFQTDDLFVSHAPVTALKNIPPDQYGHDYFFIWNRHEPRKPQDKFMIYGHNGMFRRHKHGDGTEFAICIDNSHSGRLTGIHWPTKEIFSQDFLDREDYIEYFGDVVAE